MQTKTIHLAYLGLLALLALTVSLHFPFSLYIFAVLKGFIILFAFMGLARTDLPTRVYLLIALATLGILILFVWDDLNFR